MCYSLVVANLVIGQNICDRQNLLEESNILLLKTGTIGQFCCAENFLIVCAFGRVCLLGHLDLPVLKRL